MRSYKCGVRNSECEKKGEETRKQMRGWGIRTYKCGMGNLESGI